MLTGHKCESIPVMAGLGWCSGLDEATQTCLMDATAGAEQRQISLEQNDSLRATVAAEGVTFTNADRDACIAATKPAYDRYAAQCPELVEALRDAAQN